MNGQVLSGRERGLIHLVTWRSLQGSRVRGGKGHIPLGSGSSEGWSLTKGEHCSSGRPVPASPAPPQLSHKKKTEGRVPQRPPQAFPHLPLHQQGLPLWLSWLSICLQCGRPGFDPWFWKIPWRRERLSPPVYWPGESHGLYSRKESDTTARLSLHSTPSISLGEISLHSNSLLSCYTLSSESCSQVIVFLFLFFF